MKITPLTIAFILLAGTAHAEGLSTLIEVAKSQKAIQQEYAEETRSYERVQSAVSSGAIKEGMKADQIRSRYGDPVVSYKESATQMETWVYKPATTDFLGGGPRINLYFDSEGILTGTKSLEK